MAYESKRDWFQKVAEGQYSNYSIMEKFGHNPDVDTAAAEEVWDAGGVYTFSSSADIAEIASTDDGDTQDITVIGLDASWNEVTQTVTLTGDTMATLSTPLIRVYRAYNVGTTDLDGDVTVATTAAVWEDGEPTVAATVRAKILNGNNQTLMCVYTVPAGKTGYFWGGYVGMDKSAGLYAIFTWRARVFGGVFQVKSKINCVGTGNSTWNYTYKFPLALPEKTDVVITCAEVEGNNTGVSGGFTVLLKDN